MTCFRRGAATLTPPAEPVRVPYQNATLAAYLGFRPAQNRGPGRDHDARLDSVKEELQATAQIMLDRGLAIIAVDGPGRGEAEYELPIKPGYERVATAVADYLAGARRHRPGPDRGFGVSLGSYTGPGRGLELGVRAAVSLAGPVRGP